MTHSVPYAFTIGDDHPSVPGHFPGQPVVPGVVLLDAAIAPLLQRGDRRVTHLEAAKFLAPVSFGQEVVVSFVEENADQIAINAMAAGIAVLRCRVRIGPAA